MPGAILYLERKKKQKNAPWNCFRDDFFAGEPKQLDTSCLWYSIKCQTRGVPEVICAKRHTTTCVSRHIFKVAARLVPSNNPISERALSLGPRLSLFSGVSYRRLLPNKRLLSNKRPPLRRLNCIRRPSLINAPYENYSEIQGIGKRSKVIQFI